MFANWEMQVFDIVCFFQEFWNAKNRLAFGKLSLGVWMKKAFKNKRCLNGAWAP